MTYRGDGQQLAAASHGGLQHATCVRSRLFDVDLQSLVAAQAAIVRVK